VSRDRREEQPPILAGKRHQAPSLFTPESLLREARRQKGLAPASVPRVCILDPDGDIVEHLLAEGRARRDTSWACYHTDLYRFEVGRNAIGIVGRAVGASFAVLVAEELFASGCELLLSITSSGQIGSLGRLPSFVLIERALRDEGTSYHYLPPADWSTADAALLDRAEHVLANSGLPVQPGATWTTDAPFRETAEAVAAAKQCGVLSVEMEAAALYAFASARRKAVLCVAHVTNQMGQIEGDFEKGEAGGAAEALRLIGHIVETLTPAPRISTRAGPRRAPAGRSRPTAPRHRRWTGPGPCR
jgi:uridine phosphorylase